MEWDRGRAAEGVGTCFKPSVRGGRERMLDLFLLGWGFSLCNYFFSLINFLVVCAILYILNYHASPQSIF